MSMKKTFGSLVKKIVLFSPPILMAGVGLSLGAYFYEQGQDVLTQYMLTDNYKQEIERQNGDLDAKFNADIISNKEYTQTKNYYKSETYAGECILKSDYASQYSFYNNHATILGATGLIGVLGAIPYFMAIGQYAWGSQTGSEEGQDETQNIENLSSQASC